MTSTPDTVPVKVSDLKDWAKWLQGSGLGRTQREVEAYIPKHVVKVDVAELRRIQKEEFPVLQLGLLIERLEKEQK